MKTDWTHLEPFRRSKGKHFSNLGETFGWFVWLKGKTEIRVLAVDGTETSWEHVSVTVAYQSGKKWVSRTPRWEEMCWVKAQFWNPGECVIQFHPPDKDYVNMHNHCLHLWRHVSEPFPMPPIDFV